MVFRKQMNSRKKNIINYILFCNNFKNSQQLKGRRGYSFRGDNFWFIVN